MNHKHCVDNLTFVTCDFRLEATPQKYIDALRYIMSHVTKPQHLRQVPVAERLFKAMECQTYSACLDRTLSKDDCWSPCQAKCRCLRHGMKLCQQIGADCYMGSGLPSQGLIW